jgi:TatD DNase family protein
VGGVIHCFAGRKETSSACLDLGFYLGVSGMITFKNTKDLTSLFSELPLDRLLVETDSPYLAPHPHRGKRNEPSYVVHTASRLAELKNVTLEEIENQTTENAKKLFRVT